ncbi:MlaD family protein [Terricaulis sp.]|uniref:MlaD family protein n=1 Tax=Terricaulis sp. TaxID=2768686 RepID=UPI003783A90C
METKANYVLLGAATVIGVVLFMLFAMWMANSEYRGGFNEYDVVFDDPVRGLAEGGEVRFNGIKVGEVQSLRIDPDNTNRVIARIRVSGDVPVREDSEARLEPIGLTGVTLIQLSAGSPAADLLRASGFGPPPRITGRGSQIDILVEQSENIALRASEAMAAVRDLLTDENIARVTRIIENLEKVSDDLAAEQGVINQGGRAASNLADAAEHISALAEQTQSDLSQLDQIMTNLQSASATASGETLPELTLAAEEIRRASQQIGRVAANLEENPSVLTPRAPRPTVELEQ